MTGTFVNVAAIFLGSLIGLLLKRGISERVNTAIVKAQGIAVFLIGLTGVLTSMLSVGADGELRSDGAMLLLVSLAVGCAIGEIVRIEDRLNSLGRFAERKFKADDWAKGFVTATLIFVVGAMGIVGALNDGLSGDSTILFTKAMLDFITAVILTASLGAGVAFGALPVLVVQGAVALLAGVIAPYVSDEMIRMFGTVGYALVMALGFNFLCDAKIRVANLLPALLIPILHHYIVLGILLPLFGW
ncbi:MAG: DUF554 domain-containing protein [Clostridiales Family XIII bacterium]|jgi:uncharacterized membrane protein YqgA involved in biofilm formation|nr:DUF554 domain-containing protein [Clostridiales Family XIII bacterium]